MPAYVIADVDVTEPDAYAEYQKLVPPSLEPFGGRFVVRGPEVERLEGDWEPRRLVVLEFPSLEQARAWDRVVCLNRRVVAFGDPARVLTPEVLAETYGAEITVIGEHQLAVLPPHHH